MPLPCGENLRCLRSLHLQKETQAKRPQTGYCAASAHTEHSNRAASIQDSKIKCFLEQLPLIQGPGNWFMDSTGQVLFFFGYG